MSQVFSNKLVKAEENLQIALEQLERQGLEMEVSAIPFYAIRSASMGVYYGCRGDIVGHYVRLDSDFFGEISHPIILNIGVYNGNLFPPLTHPF